MVNSTVDTTQLWKKVKATQAASKFARDAAGDELGGVFVEAVDELTNKDTNRLSNGWIEAGRKAGVSDRAMRPIVKSKNQDKYIKKLEDQVDYWAKRLEFARFVQKSYEEKDAAALPRKDGKPRARRVKQPYYQKMKKLERRAAKRVVRAGEELEKAKGADGFIFFDADSYIQRKANRSLSTVRDKVYGGDGRTEVIGGRLVIELTNKEPHGRIVEKHPYLGHPVATAKEVVRRFGIKRVAKKYRDELKARSPMANGKAA